MAFSPGKQISKWKVAFDSQDRLLKAPRWACVSTVSGVKYCRRISRAVRGQIYSHNGFKETSTTWIKVGFTTFLGNKAARVNVKKSPASPETGGKASLKRAHQQQISSFSLWYKLWMWCTENISLTQKQFDSLRRQKQHPLTHANSFAATSYFHFRQCSWCRRERLEGGGWLPDERGSIRARVSVTCPFLLCVWKRGRRKWSLLH